jgi:hypothetical protein
MNTDYLEVDKSLLDLLETMYGTQRLELKPLRNHIKKQKNYLEYQKQQQFLVLQKKTFSISIIYNTNNPNKCDVDNFELEGVDNAIMIVEQYRKISESLNLYKISIYKDGQEWKSIKF